MDPEAKTLFLVDLVLADAHRGPFDRLNSALDLFHDGGNMPNVLPTFPIDELGKLNDVSCCL
jgi:hypothetical protein